MTVGSTGETVTVIGDKWTLECLEAFSSMKEALASAPVLPYPDYSKPFVLEADASNDDLLSAIKALKLNVV